MPIYRKRTDKNQEFIVRRLRDKGYSVEVDKDDILVGYRGFTFWYEIKNPSVANKKGEVYKSAIKPSQEKLLLSWIGHYKIVTTYHEVIDDIHEQLKRVKL